MPLIAIHNFRQAVFNLPQEPDGDYWYQRTTAGTALQFNAIADDADGNTYCVGKLLSFEYLSASALCKYDSMGALVYSKVLTPALNEAKIYVDKVGGFIYLAGHVLSDAKNDVCVIKLTLAGAIVWQYRYRTDYDDYNVGGVQQFGSNVYVAFSYSNTTTPSYGFGLIQLTTDGTYVANRILTHTSNKARSTGIAVDPNDGSVYTTAYYPTGSTGLLMKTTAALALTFQKSLPSLPYAMVYADSHLYIAGQSVAAIPDTSVLKITTAGTLAMHYRYADLDSDSSGAPDETFIAPAGIAVSESGSIFVVGNSQLDKQYATVLKIDSGGVSQWRAMLESKETGTVKTAVYGCLNTANSLYVVGACGLNSFTASLSKANLTAVDFPLLKYSDNPVSYASNAGAPGTLSWTSTALSMASVTTSLSIVAPTSNPRESDYTEKTWSSGGDVGYGGFSYGFDYHLHSEYADSTCMDAAGNVYVIISHSSLGEGTSVLRKYTSSGSLVFEKTIPYAVCVTTFGSYVYVATSSVPYAYTVGSEVWGLNTGAFVIYKLNASDGSVVWSKVTLEETPVMRSLRCDSSGNVYVAGDYRHSLSTGGTGVGSYVAKYDSNGNRLWRKGIWRMGGVYQCGTLTITSNGTIVNTFFGPTTASGEDIGFVAYDSNGNVLQRVAFVSIHREYSFRIVSRDNTVYTAGSANYGSTSAYTTWRFMRVIDVTTATLTSKKNFSEPGSASSDMSLGSIASFPILDPSSTDVFHSSANFIARYNSSGVLQSVKRIVGVVREVTPTHYVIVRAAAAENRVDILFLDRNTVLEDITATITDNDINVTKATPGTGYMLSVTPDNANYGGTTTVNLDGLVFDYTPEVSSSNTATHITADVVAASDLQVL